MERFLDASKDPNQVFLAGIAVFDHRITHDNGLKRWPWIHAIFPSRVLIEARYCSCLGQPSRMRGSRCRKQGRDDM